MAALRNGDPTRAPISWPEGIIGADWGTTNRLVYLFDPGGICVERSEDDRGNLSVSPSLFASELAHLRVRVGDRPLLLAGMIGSNRGWIEAPYPPCPVGLDDLAEHLIWAEEGKTAIIPGLSYLDGDAADVMRGEELQILGAIAAGLVPADCVICHPGTPYQMDRGGGWAVIRFRTLITGELFNLLKANSIIADLLTLPVETGETFHAGVRCGVLHEGLAAELFSVRARVLLGTARREDAASYTSGLLIGSDLRIGLRAALAAEIIVMGRPELTRLFAAALRASGRSAREVDGEEAFLAGIKHLAEKMN